jgi:hypothetical protein
MPIFVYFLVLNVSLTITTPLALLPRKQVVSNHFQSWGSWILLASRRVGEFDILLFAHLGKSKYSNFTLFTIIIADQSLVLH